MYEPQQTAKWGLASWNVDEAGMWLLGAWAGFLSEVAGQCGTGCWPGHWRGCVGGSVVRVSSLSPRGAAFGARGRAGVRVRVGTGHLCRDKANIRWRWSRLCSSSARQVSGLGTELFPGLSHLNPDCSAQMGQHGFGRFGDWSLGWGQEDLEKAQRNHGRGFLPNWHHNAKCKAPKFIAYG